MASSPPSPDALLGHAAFVRAVARAALRGDDLVDDVVQETWVAALEGGAKRARQLRPWLGGVTRRQAANALRRRAVARAREACTAREDLAPPTSEVAERAETGRNLVDAVLTLPEPYRTAILLRYYDDLPPRDVAKQTGVPVETARTHVRRGLARLRQKLDDDASRRGRPAPALLLALVDGGRPPVVGLLSLVGGVLAVKKLLLAAGVVALVLFGVVAYRGGALTRTPPAPEPAPEPTLEMADAPASPRLEGRAEEKSEEPHVAAEAPTTATAPPAVVTTFRGVVVDPKGTPIPDVTIGIDPHPPWHVAMQGQPRMDADAAAPVTSDAEGRFELDVPGEVTWLNARAHATGWVGTAQYGLGFSSQGEARVVMAPACLLDVTILDDATGRPVEGAQIHGLAGVMARAYLVHPPWPVSVTRTDADGRARVELPEGRARLLVHASGYAVFQADGIALRPEGEAITLRLQRGGRVRGVVVDPRGAPVPFADVQAYAPAAWRATTRADAEGAFLLENTTPPLTGSAEALPRTHVVVQVTADGWPRAWAALPAPASGEETPLRVVLERGRTLRGRMRMADGTHPPASMIELIAMDLGTRHGYAFRPTMRGHADDAGNFAFESLPAGEVELVFGRGWSWKRTLTVEIPVEGEPTPLDVVLGDGLELPVRVVDAKGEPVQGARVLALRDPGETPYFRGPELTGRSTGEDGRIVLKDVPPETVHVVVDAPGFAPEVRTIDPTKPHPAEIDVPLGDGTIEGVAVHPDGRPARVTLRLTRTVHFERFATDQASTTTRSETDAEGRFRFEGVGEGTCGLQLDGADPRLLSFAVRLHAGETEARILVATTHEASKLHVEVLVVDAETLEPVLDDLYVSIHPEGGRGSGTMERLSEPAGVFRSTQAYAPGTHTVRVEGKGWTSGEAVTRLVWGEETPRPRLVLAREE